MGSIIVDCFFLTQCIFYVFYCNVIALCNFDFLIKQIKTQQLLRWSTVLEQYGPKSGEGTAVPLSVGESWVLI